MKDNDNEFSSGIAIKLSALKIDVTTCRNTQRITSRYKTKKITVNLHGANHTFSSDVVRMSNHTPVSLSLCGISHCIAVGVLLSLFL